MKFDWRNNKDFWSGFLLLFFGIGGFYMALSYPFGSSLRMGPGYFPRVLAAILMCFGLFILIRGMKTNEKIQGVWGWKPLGFITAAIVAFGYLMDHLGMIPALIVMFFLSAFGGHEFKFKEVAILTVCLSAFAWGVFIYGLGLPYRLFWWD